MRHADAGDGRRGRGVAGLALLLVAAVLGSAAAAGVAVPRRPPVARRAAPSADTGPYAPLARPGPALDVPPAVLAAALSCPAGLRRGGREPVLLLPGTTLDPGPNFSWNYERLFTARHWAWCALTLPAHATGDIQRAGEFVVYALRTLARRTGRRVQVVGYSQGGMVGRWALRFWPDTRRLVDDLVGLDPSNHGTLDARALCQRQCNAAFWQQAAGAHFLAALNSGAETFAGVDYTVVFSRTDEVVVPNTEVAASSALHGGGGRVATIEVQSVCPADTSEHLAMGTWDAVATAAVLDALTHPGPADPARIPAAVCAQPVAGEVDRPSFAAHVAAYAAAIAAGAAGAALLPAEPPLAAYTRR